MSENKFVNKNHIVPFSGNFPKPKNLEIDLAGIENIGIVFGKLKNVEFNFGNEDIEIKIGNKHLIKFKFACIDNTDYFYVHWNGRSVLTLQIPVEKE